MNFNIENETAASHATAFADFDQLVQLSPQFRAYVNDAGQALDEYAGASIGLSQDHNLLAIEGNGITLRDFTAAHFHGWTVAQVAEWVAHEIFLVVEVAESEFDAAQVA